MKKVICLMLAVLMMLTALAGCGGREEPAYEYLICTDQTVESYRFNFCFSVPDEFVALTADLIEMAGELTDEEVFAEGSVTVDAKEFPLLRLVMLTNFETAEYITFKVVETDADSLEDYYDSYASSLPEGSSLGEAAAIRLAGIPGCSVELSQTFEGLTFRNHLYLAVSDGYALIVNCSGAAGNESAVAAVEEQLIRTA